MGGGGNNLDFWGRILREAWAWTAPFVVMLILALGLWMVWG